MYVNLIFYFLKLIVGGMGIISEIENFLDSLRIIWLLWREFGNLEFLDYYKKWNFCLLDIKLE